MATGIDFPGTSQRISLPLAHIWAPDLKLATLALCINGDAEYQSSLMPSAVLCAIIC